MSDDAISLRQDKRGRFSGSFKSRRGKRKARDKTSLTIEEMSSVDSSTLDGTNFTRFLYSGVVKKLHKRSSTKYQKRRLEFHPDRVDYYKIDSDKRSGTIPIAGVRVELQHNEQHHFEFVFDDIKARRYVFLCESDVAKASMLWIANGEQHNNYGPTMRQLRPGTLEYMNNMKSQNIIRELILKKYKQAATYFSSGQALARDYEDADSLGIERMAKIQDSDCSSSSDDENESRRSSSASSSKLLQRSVSQTLSLKSAHNSFDEKEGYMTACSVPHAQQEMQQKFSAQKGTPSLELSEDDPNYMSLPQLKGLTNQLSSVLRSRHAKIPAAQPNIYASQGTKRATPSRPDVLYSIIYNCNDNNVVDFGAREVNAVKVKITGQVDFIEIDIADLGQTIEELKFTLCNEFDIDREEIICIRKLPDVRITNDKDVRRIRAGRKIEVEVQDA